MNAKTVAVFLAIFCLILAAAPGTPAQSLDFLTVRVTPEASIPIMGSETLFKIGGGAFLSLDLDVLPYVSPSIEAGYSMQPTLADKNLNVTSLGAGLIYTTYPVSRFGIGLGGLGGLYQAAWGSTSASNFFVKARTEFSYRFSPSFSLAADLSFTQLLGKTEALYQGLGAGLSGVITMSGIRGGTNVEVSDVKFDPVFPIFYSHYDKNKFGSLKLENKEAGDIQNVKVSLFIKQYMDQPKLCASFPLLKRGESVEAPAFALFTDQVLKLTESTKVSAEIIIDYDFLDAPRQARSNETLRMYHRNALTWDDDRKAAAFVSAKDPAVLRYSKYAAGLIRESGQSDINQNLRFAMGLFEGLKLYGVNYVIDPTTPYKELSQNKNALDFLQFPHQTLTYKGGDCDDLSILFAAILESIGIKTAFITVPGHIYMAFDLNMSEEEARSSFANAKDLIYQDKKAWLPVEITLVNDSFLKAWQVGAKEWYDNEASKQAAFIPIQDSWNQYEPVGIPGEDTRIVLPPPDQLMGAYNAALAKFITREIQPKVERVKADIVASANNPKHINRLGVLYARYGLLDQAKTEFEKAGRQNHGPSLTNLGNIYFLQKKFPEAAGYYRRALEQKSDDKTALLGLARAQYELEDYSGANIAYGRVQNIDPQLAGQYSYLVSRTEGAARAASATERLGHAKWDEE